MRSTSGRWRHSGQIQHRPHQLTTAQPPVAVPAQASHSPPAIRPESPAGLPESPPRPGPTSTQDPAATARPVRSAGALARAVAVAAYVTAALFSFLPPLLIYLLSKRSPFVWTHAAQAANVAITTAIYALCSAIAGGSLALDSIHLGLATAAVGVGLFWLIAVGNLVTAAVAASHGRTHQIPAAFCARFLGQ